MDSGLCLPRLLTAREREREEGGERDTERDQSYFEGQDSSQPMDIHDQTWRKVERGGRYPVADRKKIGDGKQNCGGLERL